MRWPTYDSSFFVSFKLVGQAGNCAALETKLEEINRAKLFAVRILLVLVFFKLDALAEEERDVFRMERLRDSFLSHPFSLKFVSVNFLAHSAFPLTFSVPLARVDNVFCQRDLPRKYLGRRD